MPSFALSTEFLVFVVIVLISAISNWFKQRQARLEEEARRQQRPLPTEDPLPPHPAEEAPSPPSGRPFGDLEEQLRRLFEEEREEPQAPAPPPRPTPTPPPVLASPRESRPPLVPPLSVEPPVRESRPAPTPVPLPAGTHFGPTADALDSRGSPEFTLAPLHEAATAYHRASHLQDQAAAKLQDALGRVASSQPAAFGPSSRIGTRTAEIAQTLALLRSPRTARQAILASVILGPPKALS